MNTKSKSKKGIIGIALAAIMIASIFAAMFSPAIALTHEQGKNTIEGPGGAENSSLKYAKGDPVWWNATYKPTSEAVTLTNVTDYYPDGTWESLFNDSMAVAKNELKLWEVNWTVPMDWPYDNFTNNVVFEGLDSFGTYFSVSAPFTSFIETNPPELDFNFNGTDCLTVEFTGWAEDNASILNFTWDFGAGEDPRYVINTTGPLPNTTTHTFKTCDGKNVKLTACNADMCASVPHTVDVVCGPKAHITYSPMCFEVNGTDITFDGSGSSGKSTPLSYNWTFTGGFTGDNDNGAITNVTVNATVTATLTVTDALNCNDSTSVTVQPCSGCSLRIYGTYGWGPGNFSVTDPETELPPENKPYTDPRAPFYPQHPQAPRKDFITFNPAIMSHNEIPGTSGLHYSGLDYFSCPLYGPRDIQTPKEKVFKRMWYEKEWFKDHNCNGVWDVVMVDGTTVMTLEEWYDIPAWQRPTIREWNSPNARGYNPDADIYGPAINQEFTYMFTDDHTMPLMIAVGSDILIPMASYKSGNGLDSFDADGDGINDYVRVDSEWLLAGRWGTRPWFGPGPNPADIDGDGLERIDGDGVELSGDETVVLNLRNRPMDTGTMNTLQFFDHVVTLTDVQEIGIEGWAIFDVCDNEGGEAQCTKNVALRPGEVKYFYRGIERFQGHPAERPTFYLRLITADAGDNTVTVEIGRMFGNTYANICGANPFWSQKAFMVDGVFYNVVAIKGQENCIKYITFRQKLPKTDIKLYGKELERWDRGVPLPEMPPFNEDHIILLDVLNTWTEPDSQYEKIGIPKDVPPLVIDYIYEDIEYRYKGELKEIYYETGVDPVEEEFWTLEWFFTQPWQYTELRLPKEDDAGKYLVTLSWRAPEAEGVLWDSDPDGPVGSWTGERFKFWYRDCSGPLYIDDNTSSIRLYGTFGEGAGDPWAIDDETDLPPENKPYTQPTGPFNPQHWQAPVKDFMTFNPAIMDHNQGYPELDYWECDIDGYPSDVQIPKEKVFKRMWYEKEWFKDHNCNGVWDVVTSEGVMTLDEWKAIPLEDRPAIREWNSDGDRPTDHPDWVYDPDADIYGPAINQEFTYMAVDDDTMPIMIGTGSKVLIPMASYTSGNGLDSFDADNDDIRDALRVDDEWSLAGRWGVPRNWRGPADIDGDGVERIDNDGNELSGDESLVLSLPGKLMTQGSRIQLFDHVVELHSVYGAPGFTAQFYVFDNEDVDPQPLPSDLVSLVPGEVKYFYRGIERAQGHPSERPTFYLRLITADADDDTAIVEVGRLFGETYANVCGANPFWSQKAFMVDNVFYNVVAIKGQDSCFKYVTFRQKLPKMPIKLYGVHLKSWEIDPVTNRSEILPEMPPFNMDHEILIDVQASWTRPYTQYDKVGDKVATDPLEIWYIEEDVEERFKGELLEIYNETFNEDKGLEYEYWNVEWFWTQPWQYTAFVMNNTDQLYLLTLAWYAPQSEITIWDNDPDGPMDSYTYERVKFWYDAGDKPLRDLYVNRVGALLPEPSIDEYYDLAGHGGDGDDKIDLQELVAAIMDYLYDVYPFGTDGPFGKGHLLSYIQAYIDQESGL